MLSVDPETLRCLEVLENTREHHSLTLFGALNQTVTLCGSRLLRSELTQPTMNIAVSYSYTIIYVCK
jgi:DNA mismatch repair ATPase MutS